MEGAVLLDMLVMYCYLSKLLYFFNNPFSGKPQNIFEVGLNFQLPLSKSLVSMFNEDAS